MGHGICFCYSLNRPSLSRPEMEAVFSNLRFSTGHRPRSLVLSPATVLHFRRDALVASNRGLCCNYSRPVVQRSRESVIVTKSDQILFLLSFLPSLFLSLSTWTDREKEREREMIRYHFSFYEREYCLSILIILVANYFYSN